MKKESWQLIEKQKSYSKSTNVKKMPKKLKIFDSISHLAWTWVYGRDKNPGKVGICSRYPVIP